ncbi:amidase family protein [Streptomyces sp. NRRL F-5126]|uniref:amidase family protein n=1 Tax=Streptomyces sp. NRRL F-5126 TaxID=1463857 RepID=UPI0018FEDF67|nr:amidase family protein [Streptomyces sp. NRRL F-5126]
MARQTAEAIERLDPGIEAFVAEPDRRGRLAREAGELDARSGDRSPGSPVRPSLHGVPVGVKDIVRVDGLDTRAGSALPPEALAGRQAALVDRLRSCCLTQCGIRSRGLVLSDPRRRRESTRSVGD